MPMKEYICLYYTACLLHLLIPAFVFYFIIDHWRIGEGEVGYEQGGMDKGKSQLHVSMWTQSDSSSGKEGEWTILTALLLTQPAGHSCLVHNHRDAQLRNCTALTLQHKISDILINKNVTWLSIYSHTMHFMQSKFYCLT